MSKRNSSPSPADDSTLPWYRGLDRYCWVVLVVAALGWLFDTMDQNIFTMVRKPSLEQILSKTVSPENLAAEVNHASGVITAVFLIGWAVGGFIFGILGDRLGRTRTMIFTILIYALFTGLCGFAQDFWTYAFLRFMTAMGVGGEWAAGAALVAETFPARSRPMALGLLQALSAVGNIMAATITLIIGDPKATYTIFGNQFDGWRIAFFIGALPALLIIWIRMSVKEPQVWKEKKEKATAGKELGNILHLFTHPVLLRHTIAACLMATAGVGALWGIGFFTPDAVRGRMALAGASGEYANMVTSWMFIWQQVGSFIGIYLFAVVCERIGRRPTFAMWFIFAWIMISVFFWSLNGVTDAETVKWRAWLIAPILGFATLGPFSGFTIYFPELFPTRLRATGCGFCYNAARILAAFAPFVLGGLATWLGGFAPAASVVSCIYVLGLIGAWLGPETKGQPLPEHL